MHPDDHVTPDGSEEERIRALLHDTVADVTPSDGLAEIRRRTRPRASHRRWTPVLVAAGAVAAVVVGASVVVAGLGDDDQEPPDGGIAASSDPDAELVRATAVYFLSETPTGPRLYREFQQLPGGSSAEVAEVALDQLAVDRGPEDPDYWTVWPSGSFETVEVSSDRITVELGSERALERPAGVAHYERQLSVQQAVYTAEAAVGEALPVAFEWDGESAKKVLGVDVKPLVPRDSHYSITAPVNISDPTEGEEVSGTFVARGSVAEYVGLFRWSLRSATDPAGSAAMGAAVMPGTVSDGASEAPGWETGPIDVSGLPPGEYVFTVRARSVGQTSDAPSVFTDTRTITVR